MNYLDLFSGCGGLSLGLRAAGLQGTAAVEKSPMAAETYFRNLISPSAEAFQSHIAKDSLGQIDGGLLVDEAGELVRILQTSLPNSLLNVDVVVGGPPCQGFSLAGKRNPNDKRNQLPWLFLDVVSKLSPKFVVIENVAGMKIAPQLRSDSPFEALALALSNCGPGYEVQRLFLDSAHFGAPQHRLRLFLIGIRKDLAEQVKARPSSEIWRSKFADIPNEPTPFLAPAPTVSQDKVRTVRDAIFDLSGHGHEATIYSDEIKKKFSKVLVERPPTLANHSIRKHSERTRQRFALIQLLNEHGIRFSDPDFKKIDRLHFPLCDNFANKYESADVLKKTIGEFQTKKHSQKLLDWERPSPTVLTIPDDYVHPSQPRVLTVREMARIQGFPDEFSFHSKVTTGGQMRSHEVPQYSQVGNAVSPWVAIGIGQMLLRVNQEVG